MNMENEKTGGPAYPVSGSGHNSNPPVPGMTLLDHFAGLAMQGYWASVVNDHDGVRLDWLDPKEPMMDGDHDLGKGTATCVARCAYTMAAAMIAERNRLMNEKP